MQLQQIKVFFNSELLNPILLVFGEEDFFIDTAFSQVTEFIKKREIDDFDVTIVNGSDTTEDFIVSTCLSYPFISPQKLVVVKHFELLTLLGMPKKKSDPTPAFLTYLSNPNPSTCLIIFTNDKKLWGYSKSLRSKKETKLPYPYFQISQSFDWVEYQKISESSIPKWLSETSKQFGFELTPEASEGLLHQIGTNVRELHNELMKISTYSKDKKTVTYNDVAEIVGMSREYSVLEFTKAFNEKNGAKASEILFRLLEHDKIELLLVGSLTRSVLQIWSLKEAQLENRPFNEQLEVSGINRYFFDEYRVAASKYSLKELDQMIIDLTDIDTALKSTTKNSKILFLEFFSKHLPNQL